MKNILALSSLLVLTLNLRAQPFKIDRFAISGGGGTSTGGTFTVMGTIGQHDAGDMSGADFRITGGFWSVLGVIQVSGAPFLSISRSNASVVISWPAPSSGFSLEENANLNTANWTSVAIPPVTVGAEQRVVVAAPSGNRFYRLRKP